MNRIKKYFKGNPYTKRQQEIAPDEILIDAENLPEFDEDQFEGRLEKTISAKTFFIFGFFCMMVLGIFFSRSLFLQAANGEKYLARSEKNRLRNTILFAKRGIIFDRNDEKLAWNVASDTLPEYNLRKYTDTSGISTVLGYLKYPSKDKYGFYYSEDFIGKDGVEKTYNERLTGQNGKRIIEVDAAGKIESENLVEEPKDGQNLKLSIDAALQHSLFSAIEDLYKRIGFYGGAGVIMDIHTGEIIAMASYPEFDSQVMTDGNDQTRIKYYLNNKNNHFLDRVTNGLYTPGSIVKPFMSYAVLSEKVIDPLTNIYSSGQISLPNPYDPSNPSIFKDWKAHGYVDMRKAIAVSSDVYFYEVGGGFENQKGLGIEKIDQYMKMFGFGQSISSDFFEGLSGTIPTPEWKQKIFNEDWRVGDTYHTSIGQYGFQVSPIQIVRGVSAIANGGKLLYPSILYGGEDKLTIDLNLNSDYLKIIKEGMHDTVIKDYGSARSLLSNDYTVAAKTGTAELGSKKQFVNSWAEGFFPYENPKYAFAVIMEKGPTGNTMGGIYVMRQVLDWMAIYRPEYLK